MTPIKRAVWIGAMVCLVAGLPAADVHAQPTPDRIERELDRTDELLQRAFEVVRESVSDRPREVLRSARDLQLEAREAFADRHYEIAARRTALARNAAGRAVDLATAERRLLDHVRQIVAGNDDLSARVRERVTNSGNAEALRLMEGGMGQLRRGQRALHDRDIRAAVRFSLFGRDLLHRALRAVEGDGNLDEARVRDDIARTAEFLEQAKAGAGDGVARQLDEARRLQRRAEQELRGRRLARARQLTERARELVLDALRAERDEPSADDVRAHIDRVDARYRSMKDAARDDAVAGRLLAQAREHLDEAARALAQRKYRRALAEAQLANSLLDQIETGARGR